MWRRFQFFEKELIKEPGSKEAKQSLKKIGISCSSGGNGHLFFGDIEGGIHVVDRDLNIVYYFKAYTRSITNMKQGVQRNILVTIGNDEDSIEATVKIWNLEVMETLGYPTMCRSFKLGHMLVTELAVSADCSALAVGMADGTAIITIGDITKERSSVFKSHIRHGYPITAMGFVTGNRKLNLFAVTSDSVSVVEITREGPGDVEALDEKGCEVGCATVTSTDELVIGRKEAIYFYNSHGRGPCRAFEGDRKIMTWFRNYLIVVDQAPTNIKYNTLTIYDDKNKFIGYSGSFENVSAIVSEWGLIFVVTKDGTVYKLVEKDTQTKLETLFRKNLYQVAIDMADSNHLDKNAIVDIFVQYGDHLYDKGDYDGAIEQYIKTIGFGTIEPSYVIKQFLDAQRIHNLTLYLEKLHEAGEANDNHTTLLLNCYTKLKQRENSQKLDEFIKKPELKFDVETAIRVCRQAGYYEHVLELAKRTGSHYWYLKVLLEDLRRDREALEYIQSLPFAEAQVNVRKYGQLLAQTLPAELTCFLLNLCVGSRQQADPDQFIQLFVNSPEYLVQFLESVQEKGKATTLVYNTLLELYLRGDEEDTPTAKKERHDKALELLMNPQATYDSGTALVLCQMQDFKQGQLCLYEKMMLYNEILQHYMDIDDYSNVVKTCRKYSKVAPYLWARALVFLTDKDPELNLKQEIIEVLRNIDSNNIFPPNQVIKMLSQSKAYLGLITAYTSKHIQEQEKEIAEDTKRIKLHQEETAKNRQEIVDLTLGVKKFQFHKCTRCSQVLDLPAVHFLCNHSFHQRCLGENENICPECAEDNKDFRNRQRALEENARKHSEFFRQLENAGNSDGFSTIAKYFGRGVFDKPQQESIEAGVLPTLDPGLFQDLVGTLITELKK